MRHLTHLLNLLFILLLYECASAQSLSVNSFQQFDLEVSTNIRALEVLNDSVVWFGGSNGIYGFTEDAGKTWTIDTIKMDSLIPEFRSIAVLDDHTELLVNIGSPAYIWKSDDIGVTWKIVYENHDDDIFFDALKFSDEINGIAVSDPIRQCFQILITHDSGETWQSVSCSAIPPALGGEAFFASSNTSIDVSGRNVWLGTGALHTRVLASQDAGAHWKTFEAPILEGQEFTGIFSLDFYDNYTGIIAGGDYDEKPSTILTAAVTNDGGKTWKAIDEEDAPPFVSCVQYRPHSNGTAIIACCLPGIYSSEDGGLHWKKLKNDNERGKELSESFLTFRFSPSGKVAWFAGADGKIARLELK